MAGSAARAVGRGDRAGGGGAPAPFGRGGHDAVIEGRRGAARRDCRAQSRLIGPEPTRSHWLPWLFAAFPEEAEGCRPMADAPDHSTLQKFNTPEISP